MSTTAHYTFTRTAPTRLRPLNTPTRVRMRATRDGRPVALYMQGRWRGVAVVRERWRIDDEWWRRTISRDYREVVLSDGKPLMLFRDRVEGGWFVHG